MATVGQGNDLEKMGPLARLVGIWEGVKGADVAPSDDRGTEQNSFHERITFDPIEPVQNHEQQLFGLRYATIATRIGDKVPFHEEVGYWLWDLAARQVMKSFIVPRGITVLAGGSADALARELKLVAELGSPTFGICSNPFLDREFRTFRFELTVRFQWRESRTQDEWSYDEDTQLMMPGRPEVFHHTDRNVLRRK